MISTCWTVAEGLG